MSNFGTRAESDLITRGQAESVVKRVYDAVKLLCTEKGDVRDRLKVAALVLVILPEEDFPEYLQKDYKWIMTQVSRYKSQNPKFEGNIDATMRRIKNARGQIIAKRILKLYSDIQDIRGFPLMEYRNPKE
ncbi:MAG: hypothetical protein ABSC61_09885 [Anaerolineales bacterium]